MRKVNIKQRERQKYTHFQLLFVFDILDTKHSKEIFNKYPKVDNTIRMLNFFVTRVQLSLYLMSLQVSDTVLTSSYVVLGVFSFFRVLVFALLITEL